MDHWVITISMQGGGAPLQFLIGEGSHLLGRDNHCSVQVLSDSVSGEHARLILSPQGIFIEDLASTSGTYIDGIRIVGKVEVTAKQVIHVSDTEISLSRGGSAQEEQSVHIFQDGTQYGPYTIAQVKQHLSEGSLRKSDLACIDGGTQWVKLGSFLQENPNAQPELIEGSITPVEAQEIKQKYPKIMKWLAPKGQHKDGSFITRLLDNFGRVATIVAIITSCIGGIYWAQGFYRDYNFKKKVLASATGRAGIYLDSMERGNYLSTDVAHYNFSGAGKGGFEGYYYKKELYADGSVLKRSSQLSEYAQKKLKKQAEWDPDAESQIVESIITADRPPLDHYLHLLDSINERDIAKGKLSDSKRHEAWAEIKRRAENSQKRGSQNGRWFNLMIQINEKKLEDFMGSGELKDLRSQILFGEEYWGVDRNEFQKIKDLADEGHHKACSAMALYLSGSTMPDLGMDADKENTITALAKGGAADRAGFKIGDASAGISNGSLRRAITSPGFFYGDTIKVMRNGTYVDVTPSLNRNGLYGFLPPEYNKQLEMLHKYSWEGAQRGNPAAMAILANFYGKGLASRFLKMDPKLECILAYKWMAQWEYLSYPETGKVAPKDSNLETIEIPLIGGRNFFPDHNANNRLLFAINRFGRLIFFPNMYFAVGVSKERRIKDFSLYHIRAMNWKDPKNPIPISDSEIKAAMSKVDEFVPNQLLAECGDKNAQMALAMSLHSAGEYPVSYKWMLLAEKGGHKLAKIRLEKFDWESAHKKEGKKLAQNFSAKKNPYPYSW